MAIFSSPLSWSKNNSVMVLVHLLNCSCLETLNVSFVMHRCFVFANCLLILLFNYDYLCAVALYMHVILQYILFGFYIDVISLFESFHSFSLWGFMSFIILQTQFLQLCCKQLHSFMCQLQYDMQVKELCPIQQCTVSSNQ